MTTADTSPAPEGTVTWHDAGALRELRELRTAGDLEERYTTVPRLLARMPRTDLPRAGQILARLDRKAVGRHHPEVPVVTALITGHSTVAPLVAPLTAELARHGLLLDPQTSEYDSYVRDLLSPDSRVYEEPSDLTLCLLDPYVVLDELPSPWRIEDIESAVRAKLDLLRGAARSHRERGGGLLVFNTVPLLRHVTHLLIDHRSRALLGALWREFNAGLLRLAAEYDGVCVIDLDPLVARGTAAYEPRTGTYAKMRLSEELLADYAREVAHLARNRTGRTKKCLVLDLDGTLWGGILGEDGPDGIEIGETYRGEAFRGFQRIIKQLSSQGVLLAVSSKNDQEPVLRTLREHPGMELREADFVRVNANWNAKHTNLLDIAERLNVGVDSFVFVDDSVFECGLVREQLPEVAVVRVDDEPALHTEALLADGWFDVLQVTEEDRARSSLYRTEAQRQDFREDFDSYGQYLRGLGIEVTMRPPTPAELPRVSQLTLRTNQFNMTTERLQLPEVESRTTDADASTLVVHTSDRFGDHGLVGALFLSRDGDRLLIENFVLSCRVFSRNIEDACLSAVLEHAGRLGCRQVVGRYRPTPKNTAFREFYPRHGFALLDDAGDEAVHEHDLHAITPVPDHLTLRCAFEEGQS